MGRPKKIKVVSLREKKVEYVLELTLGENTIKSFGSTLLLALKSLPRPTKIFTKGFLVVTDGSRKAEVVLTVSRVKRLFYPLAQIIQAKQLNYLLK